MHIVRFVQAVVRPRTDKNEIFILMIYLLQLPDRFQSHKIHPMLVGTEYTLGFNGNLHV